MAGESDAERLVVLLEARIRDFEKNMQKASGMAGKTYGRMRRDSKSATAAMEADMQRSTSRINQILASTSTKIGAFGKGLIGGLVAGGVVGVVSQIGQIARGIAEIGDKAKMAGLSTQAFQELGYVARQNRIEVDALTDGMKELQLRSDEWIVTGKGPAAEAFQRLGYTADELKRKLKDPSALFTEIIGKLEKLDKAARIRIADELFGGTGGEKFVQLIDQGEKGIRDTIAEARRLGIVLNDEVIEKAAELDRRFNKVTETVGAALKTAIVEAADALSRFINEFNRLEQRRLEAQRAAEAGAWVGGMVKAEGDALTFGKSNRPTTLDARMAGALATELSQADQRLVDALRKRYSEASESAAGITPPSKGGGGAAKKEDAFQPARDGFAEMIGATEQWREEQELANQRLEDFGNLAIDAGNSLATALADGKLEGQELLSILQQVVSELIRMAQTSGGFGNLFSGLFGGGGFNPTSGGFASMLGLPGYAKGGVTDRPAIFGEGPLREAAVPLPDGRRIPVDLRGSSGGSNVEVSRTINVSVTGARGNAEIMEMVKVGVTQGIKQYDKTSPVRFPRDARNAKSRGAF